MLNRFKNHCKNPVTWGAYYKLCGICFTASTVITVAMVIKYMHDIKSFYNFETNDDDSEEKES